MSKLPKILCVMEKWCDLNPAYGESLASPMLGQSLINSQLAEVKPFFYDSCDCDQSLIETARIEQPDILIVSSMYIPSKGNWAISSSTLYQIKQELNCKIVIYSWDTIPEMPIIYDQVIEWLDLLIMIDSHITCDQYQKKHPQRSKHIIYFPGIHDTNLFNNPNKQRNIDISFVGRTDPSKMPLIDALRANNINVQKFGGQRESFLSWEQYADIYQRSNMTFNYCIVSGMYEQLKSRVWEALLCGSVLVDIEAPILTNFFIPMIDYIAYRNEDDLIKKVQYYLEHPQETEQIRKNGYNKAMYYANPTRWWKHIIDYLNLGEK